MAGNLEIESKRFTVERYNYDIINLNAKVKDLREITEKFKIWSPVGLLDKSQLEFLLEKEILEKTIYAYFFIWKEEQGFKKWIGLRKVIFENYLKGNTEAIFQYNDIDIIQSAIEKKAIIEKRRNSSFRDWQKQVLLIKPTPTELKQVPLFQIHKDICEDIERRATKMGVVSRNNYASHGK